MNKPLPAYYRNLSSQSPAKPSLRDLTAAAMQCPKCQRNLLITPSGFLCCEDFNCGKLIPALPRNQSGRMVRLSELRIAWPDRAIMRDKPLA